MFHSKFSSNIHHFRGNDVFLKTGNYVMVLYPLGALYAVPYDGFWKADYGFLFVFRRNCSSIIHRFRDNEVFLQTENDGISISPPGGAVYSSQRRNLKGHLWCPISVL